MDDFVLSPKRVYICLSTSNSEDDETCDVSLSDGGEEEEEAVGQDRLLDAAQHRGQGCHQEAGREIPQEEGRRHGNDVILSLHVHVQV